MESSNGIVLSRRAVIAMAPVGAIAAAGLAPGLAASPYDLGRDASADAGAIAMAYWAGSAALGPQQSWTLAQGRPTIAEPEERSTEAAEGRPQPVDLVPAESLAGGDPAFILYGARVAIHGLVAMKWTGEGRLPPIAIDVDYNPARAQRFSAWSLSQRDEGPSISGPIAIDVPASAEKVC